jgi:hypothetical protein
MKKVILASLCFLLVSSVNAQQLPNPGFENWTGSGNSFRPTDWMQINAHLESVDPFLAAFVPTTCFQAVPPNVNSGSFAINLKTVFATIQISNGIATTGTIDHVNETITGGLSYIDRPDSLAGYYMYSPQGADFGTVEFVLKDAQEDTIGWARFETPNATVGQMTYFSVPVVYTNSNTPTTAVALISASDGFNPVVDSEIWVDDLELIFNPTGVEEKDIELIDVFSTNNEVIVDMEGVELEKPQLTIYNINGQQLKMVQLNNLSRNTVRLNVAAGVYVCKIQSASALRTVKVFVR